jgi:phospholipase C
MHIVSRVCFALGLVCSALLLPGCQGLKSAQAVPPPDNNQPFTVTVTPAGGGSGMVTSAPSGIDCGSNGSTCTATFQPDTQVTLTATADSGFQFAGWSGACSGTGDCTVPSGTNSTMTATFAATLQSINHIVFMVQENRSFDHYFGALREYWRRNGFPDQELAGLPQFNNPAGALASNPGCDPAFPFQPSPAPRNDCVTVTNGAIDPNSPQVTSFKLITQCVENPSPSWNESHTGWNVVDPVSMTATMDGFVHAAAHGIRDSQYMPGQNPPESDYDGVRVMGYYDWDILPYYYFVASNFAISDMWFSPVMTRTQPNREFLMAATSLGTVYPPAGSGDDVGATTQFPNKTIFQALEENKVSWRIYVSDSNGGSLPSHTELGMYSFANLHKDHFVAASEFLKDAQNGNLPAVAEIDPGFGTGTSEHAEQDDSQPGGRIQRGAQYVADLINGLMQTPSWKDTVFILTWDEGGGFYDHVPPHQWPVSPDSFTTPVDLKAGDVCSPPKTGPNCEFKYTGYRVPVIIVSPFSKKNFVSHTPADYTAILKFIETRFLPGFAGLTARDAGQIDMTEFFDFTNVPWKTPPPASDIPVQPNTAPCYMDKLP